MAAKGNRPKSSRSQSNRTTASNTKPSTSQAGKGPGRSSARAREQVIPEAVANRMARRVAFATGIPTLLGMGVFVGSYLLVSRQIVDIAPGLTLTASGACFLLGLLGLSYGVLSASWEPQPGSLLGSEQLGLNIGRIKQSLAAMRQRRDG
jgi:drug/metabolite transporter (DMT)-like permease